MTLASDLVNNSSSTSSTTETQLPENLAQKIDAASSIEEVKRILMDALLSRDIVIPAQHQADWKSQAILDLRQKYSHLIGKRINRSEAAVKYGVAASSIQTWENQKLEDGSPFIAVYDRGLGRGSRILIDEGHVAAMAAFNATYRKERNRSGPLPLRRKAS